MSWIATIASVCISSRHAVAPGLGADVDHRIAGAGGARVEDLILGHEAHAHHVHQDVAVVGAVEGGLAADRRHADAVAVAGDAGDHAVDQMARARLLGRAEAERIEERHRAGTHGEDVTQDAADPGRRALIWLDEARMVVALDLEDGRHTIAEVDHARVLARPADHPWRLARQPLQPVLRRLVRAVLAPHHGKDAELDQVRGAPEDLEDAGVLGLAEAVLGNKLGGDPVGLGAHRCQGLTEALDQGPEQRQTVGAAEPRIGRALGVRHQAEHVAP
jgi:hypothetical protein